MGGVRSSAKNRSGPEKLNRSERGSALLLFPAGILIVFVLAAIAVDLSAAFLAQRELADATSAAAADAAAALAPSSFYGQGRVDLDPESVERVAHYQVISSLNPDRHRDLRIAVIAVRPPADDCPWSVTVSAASAVDHVFGQALPGGKSRTLITATSSSQPRQRSQPGC